MVKCDECDCHEYVYDYVPCSGDYRDKGHWCEFIVTSIRDGKPVRSVNNNYIPYKQFKKKTKDPGFCIKQDKTITIARQVYEVIAVEPHKRR